MKLARKQSISFGFMLAIVVAVVGALHLSTRLSVSRSESVANSLSQLLMIKEIDAAINEQFEKTINILVFGGENASKDYAACKEMVSDGFAGMQKSLIQEKSFANDNEIDGELAEIAIIKKRYDELSGIADSLISVASGAVAVETARKFDDLINQKYYGGLKTLLTDAVHREVRQADDARQEERNASAYLSWLSSIITVATFASFAIILLMVIKTIIRPLRRISDVAQEIGKGNFDAKIDIASKDEIGDLAKSFSAMADNLKKNTVAIDYANFRTEEILESLQKVARGDLSTTCEIREKNDNFDALAAALNMMVDDIKNHIEEKENLLLQEKELAIEASKAEAERKNADELRAANQQLRAGEQQLRAANQQLTAKEQALRASQTELTKKIAELEQFNKLMVGRELAMIKLKERINVLLEETGRAKEF
jgi:HAMP domain-containing protein